MAASKLMHFFSSNPASCGFWASSSLGNITLNLAKKKSDQSLSDFQTGIGAAAHDMLDAEQLNSHMKTVLVDTIFSLQGSNGGVLPVSEVFQLPTKIHDIPGNTMSKKVDSTACNIYHFSSTSRLCHVVWMPICMFLLLRIIIIFYILFGIVNLTVEGFAILAGCGA